VYHIYFFMYVISKLKKKIIPFSSSIYLKFYLYCYTHYDEIYKTRSIPDMFRNNFRDYKISNVVPKAWSVQIKFRIIKFHFKSTSMQI